MHLHCMCIRLALGMTGIRSGLALFDDIVGLRQFRFNALVLPPIREQGGDNVAAICPLVGRHPGNAGDEAFVGRQRPLLPVVHDQQHIRAMLSSGQVPGVSQIVSDVQRHPSAVAHRLCPACADLNP